MVRKSKRRGGMMRAIGRPLGKATIALGESVGKDYLQNKSLKVAKGIYDDPMLAKNPGFLMTGLKRPESNPNIKIYNNENAYDNENINPNIKMNNNATLFDNFGGTTKRNHKIKNRRKKNRTIKSRNYRK